MAFYQRIGRIITIYYFAALLIGLSACSQKTSPTPAPDEIGNTAMPLPTEIIQITALASPMPTVAARSSATAIVQSPDPPEPIMGMQVHQMSQEAQADLFYQSGAMWTRHDYIRWEDLEPENTTPENYLWDRVDEDSLLVAVKDGRQTIVNVVYTPAWAQKYPGVACGPIAEDALDDFAEFLSAIVGRYSEPPYNVQYWEIGNEPDIDRKLVDGHSIYGCWGEEDDLHYGGGYYAEMLKAVYPAIKAADPDARVLVGGLVLDCDPVNPPVNEPGSGELRVCSSSTFLEGILKSGGGDYLDGVSFHAYDYYFGEEGSYGNAGWHSTSDTTGPVLSAKASYLRSLLNTSGFPEKELLNTELAVLCGRDGREDYCQTEEYANTKAYYVAQANAAAFDSGLRANLWYSLTGWRGSGLVDSKLQPNVAFQAYKVAASQFNDAIYLGKVTQYPGIMGYQFENESNVFWLLWSLDGQERILQLDSAPSAIMDIFGETQENTGGTPKEVKISAPIYIEWQK